MLKGVCEYCNVGHGVFECPNPRRKMAEEKARAEEEAAAAAILAAETLATEALAAEGITAETIQAKIQEVVDEAVTPVVERAHQELEEALLELPPPTPVVESPEPPKIKFVDPIPVDPEPEQ